MSQEIPVEIIERLSQQGLTEMEIISQLKLRGFQEDQIHKGIQTSIKQGVVGKPGIPARPHRDAAESEISIPRHPEATVQKPASTLPPRQQSSPLSKPPENIKLPEDLKPMSLDEIGFKKTNQPGYTPAQKPNFIENAPVQPKTPAPMTPKIVAASPVKPVMKPAQPKFQQAQPPMTNQIPRHPIQVPGPAPQKTQPSQTQPPKPTPIPTQAPPVRKVAPTQVPRPMPKPIQKPAPRVTTAGPMKPRPLKPKARHEDITLEELVEEVVTDEIHKVNKQVTELLNRNTKLQETAQAVNKKISKLAKITDKKTSQIDVKVGETSSRIIAMENRIAALEEAFKSLGAAMNKTAPRKILRKA